MTLLAIAGAAVFAVSTFGVIVYNYLKPSKPKTELVKKAKIEKIQDSESKK